MSYLIEHLNPRPIETKSRGTIEDGRDAIYEMTHCSHQPKLWVGTCLTCPRDKCYLDEPAHSERIKRKKEKNK